MELRGNASREEVSKGIGVSVSALQMYENGHRIPKDDIKVKIASYFNNKSFKRMILINC